jgi:hypothetical protein
MREGVGFLQDDFARLREALGRRFALSGKRQLLRARRALDALEAYLRRPLRLAAIGEQNTGKSSLINMLLRDSIVPTGALAGMRAHLMLRYGPDTALYAVAADGTRARLTSRALARLAVPDSRPPASGTGFIYNAAQPSQPSRRPELAGLGFRPPPEGAAKLIEMIVPHDFLRSAELVEARAFPEDGAHNVPRHALPVDQAIWCTLATQAWKETERQSWRRMPAKLRKNAVLLVTYKDALGTARDEARLLRRLERDAGPSFGSIYFVSLRQAGEAIADGGRIADQGKWERSGAAAFEAAMQIRMTELARQRRLRGLRMYTRLAALAAGDPGTSASATGLRPAEDAPDEPIRHIDERSQCDVPGTLGCVAVLAAGSSAREDGL